MDLKTKAEAMCNAIRLFVLRSATQLSCGHRSSNHVLDIIEWPGLPQIPSQASIRRVFQRVRFCQKADGGRQPTTTPTIIHPSAPPRVEVLLNIQPTPNLHYTTHPLLLYHHGVLIQARLLGESSPRLVKIDFRSLSLSNWRPNASYPAPGQQTWNANLGRLRITPLLSPKSILSPIPANQLPHRHPGRRQ